MKYIDAIDFAKKILAQKSARVSDNDMKDISNQVVEIFLKEFPDECCGSLKNLKNIEKLSKEVGSNLYHEILKNLRYLNANKK